MQAIARSPRKIKNSEANHKVVSSLSMAASVLLRCHNPHLSAAACRFSVAWRSWKDGKFDIFTVKIGGSSKSR